jgi:hypothetical protein
MQLVIDVLKDLFFALPGLVAFLIAAAALAVFYMEELQVKLKEQRIIRWAVATVLLLMGVGAFAADKIQKNQERLEREQAIKDTSRDVAAETSKQVTKVITDQYSQMVADQKREIDELQKKLEAQGRDVSVIKSSNIVSGKKPIQVEVTNPTSAPVNSSLPSLPNLSWTQEVVTTTADGKPVEKPTVAVKFRVDGFLNVPAFLAVCDGPCSTLSATSPPMSQATYLNGGAAQPNVAGALYNTPRPLASGVVSTIQIASSNGQTIKVLSFRILRESELPINLR